MKITIDTEQCDSCLKVCTGKNLKKLGYEVIICPMPCVCKCHKSKSVIFCSKCQNQHNKEIK